MKVVCPHCQARYSVADERIGDRVYKARCRRCERIIMVERPQPRDVPLQRVQHEAAREGNPLAVWHAVIDRTVMGPMTGAELRTRFAGGELGLSSYVWCPGFTSWRLITEVPELGDLTQPIEDNGQVTRRTTLEDLGPVRAAPPGDATVITPMPPMPDEAPDDEYAPVTLDDIVAEEEAVADGSDSPYATANAVAAWVSARVAAEAPLPHPEVAAGPRVVLGQNLHNAETALIDLGPFGQELHAAQTALHPIDRMTRAGARSAAVANAAVSSAATLPPGYVSPSASGTGLVDMRMLAKTILDKDVAEAAGREHASTLPLRPLAAPVALPKLRTVPAWFWPVLVVLALAVGAALMAAAMFFFGHK